ncbi:MAG: hypothetical protein WC285_06330 [Candidatus Gracilibacteria bacterium]
MNENMKAVIETTAGSRKRKNTVEAPAKSEPFRAPTIPNEAQPAQAPEHNVPGIEKMKPKMPNIIGASDFFVSPVFVSVMILKMKELAATQNKCNKVTLFEI